MRIHFSQSDLIILIGNLLPTYYGNNNLLIHIGCSFIRKKDRDKTLQCIDNQIKVKTKTNSI